MLPLRYSGSQKREKPGKLGPALASREPEQLSPSSVPQSNTRVTASLSGYKNTHKASSQSRSMTLPAAQSKSKPSTHRSAYPAASKPQRQSSKKPQHLEGPLVPSSASPATPVARVILTALKKSPTTEYHQLEFHKGTSKIVYGQPNDDLCDKLEFMLIGIELNKTKFPKKWPSKWGILRIQLVEADSQPDLPQGISPSVKTFSINEVCLRSLLTTRLLCLSQDWHILKIQSMQPNFGIHYGFLQLLPADL